MHAAVPPEDFTWIERVEAVVNEAHNENWGGKHRTGFCEACADAYIVAQHAVPGGPGSAVSDEKERTGD